MTKRILIMAGGTGGHVFPALAVADYLREQHWQVSWLGTQKGLESRVIPAHGIAIDWLSVSGVRGKGVLTKLKGLLNLVTACWQALCILRKRKPDVVLGMGGFVAGPGGLMAKLLGIPLVIHEQNRIPGTTNKILAKFANQTLEAFPNSFATSVHAHCTGNPLRKDFVAYASHPEKTVTSALHLLIIGGSQGAQILNEIVPDALANIPTIQVKHQTGSVMVERVNQHYQRLGIQAEVKAFYDDIITAYAWADLIICRAGAMTVSEVAALGLPAILIPLPSAIDDHQTANARYLTEANAGVLLMQQQLTPETLAEKIHLVMANLSQLSEAATHCARLDATEKVAQFCVQAAHA